METKLNRRTRFVVFTCVILLITGTMAFGQKTAIHVDSININGLHYNDDINEVKKIFGSPKKYKEIEQKMGLAGYDALIKIKYDSLLISYIKSGNKLHMHSIDIKGEKYSLFFNSYKVNITTPLSKLEDVFPKEYGKFKSKHLKKEEDKSNLFSFDVGLKIPVNSNTEYYGVIKFWIKENSINRITIGFME
jgi:hypothetical protein